MTLKKAVLSYLTAVTKDAQSKTRLKNIAATVKRKQIEDTPEHAGNIQGFASLLVNELPELKRDKLFVKIFPLMKVCLSLQNTKPTPKRK